MLYFGSSAADQEPRSVNLYTETNKCLSIITHRYKYTVLEYAASQDDTDHEV